DIMNFAAVGTMARTMGAALIHEIAEVYDSVKDGKTKPISEDGGKDLKANHNGSAKDSENAVEKEEAGITRTSKYIPAGMSKTGNVITYRLKASYDKNGTTVYLDDVLQQTGDNAPKVVKSEPEPAKPKKCCLYITEEEPGLATFNNTFQSIGFLPLDKPG